MGKQRNPFRCFGKTAGGSTDQSYFPFDPRTSQAFPNRSMIDFVFMM